MASSGFAFVFDNVQFETMTKHHSMARKKSFHLFTMSLAVKDRIHPTANTDTIDKCPAVDLSDCVFIPGLDDYNVLRKHLTVVVQSILADYVPIFEGMRDHVMRHVPHEFSKE